MNTNKTFGSFRQMYVAAMRAVTISTVLAISVLVVAQNYVAWMPNMNR